MWKILQKLNKNLIVAIPAMLVAGFLFGLFAGAQASGLLKLGIIPLTILMVYPMMVTLDVRHLKHGLDMRLQLSAQLLNFGLIPFIAFLLGRVFFPSQPFLALGLLLAALLPTSGMTISWTGFARGNVSAAINMTVIGLTLGSLLTPIYVSVLLGAKVDINLGHVVKQILFIVFLPLLAGQITRYMLLRRYGMADFASRLAPRFPALSTLGVLGIVFVAMALKAPAIIAQPEVLLRIVLPLTALYLINYVLATMVGKVFFQRDDAIALVYGTVMRNLSIALAIAMTSFGETGAQAALVVAVAYIIQVQSAAWFVRLTDRLFGRHHAEEPAAVGNG